MLTQMVALVLGLVSVSVPVPPTYDELPMGAPTTLPWWQGGQLHVGGAVIATGRSDIVSRGGTTVVAADGGRSTGGPATWFVVEGGTLEQLPMRTRGSQPLVSADGRWLAWAEVRAPRTEAYRRVQRYRVVLYDVERQGVANLFRDRRSVAQEDGDNGIWLRTLSNRGRLVLSQGSAGVKVLSPRGRPVRFGGPQVGNGVDLDGWPGGTTVWRSKSEASVYGTVGRNGGFDQVGRFTVSWSGLWSADGSAYAYTDYGPDGNEYWVRRLDGASVRLTTPSDVRELRIVGWESPDAVVLWSFDDYSGMPSSRLVRCSAATGSCERVPGGPLPGSPATMSSPY
ncbi:hypothetical protein EUA06_19180 [Nocardioides glacieisoli]|uniref:WD40 repeat domain-containing protein n=1 Tax=Nocardioides glacieisoli TaxID=1168730 RepID=A0A4Q2RJK6_9ACTN|nr:hypothetical protein [Nocardioides glacieisoli]RYB88900.1 hypothetical protein EUA06_19180 [Nocardioides glacieisoli]